MPECNDTRCPVHGQIKVRGNIFTGLVVSAKAPKTVKVERVLAHYVPKYERYKKVRSRIAAHNPPCINALEGDIVQIGETRKTSKTKAFVVLAVTGKGRKALEVEEETVNVFEEKKKSVEKAKVRGKEEETLGMKAKEIEAVEKKVSQEKEKSKEEKIELKESEE